MKIVLCDASPLIFLAKLDALDLISEIFCGEVVILKCVAEEVCSKSAGDVERIRLHRLLETAAVIAFEESDYPSRSLSENDRRVLNWAIQNRPDRLVADERLLRRIAREEGIATIGTFGILVAAAKKGIRSREVVRKMVDDLVGKHGCRVSVALYQRVISELEK